MEVPETDIKLSSAITFATGSASRQVNEQFGQIFQQQQEIQSQIQQQMQQRERREVTPVERDRQADRPERTERDTPKREVERGESDRGREVDRDTPRREVRDRDDVADRSRREDSVSDQGREVVARDNDNAGQAEQRSSNDQSDQNVNRSSEQGQNQSQDQGNAEVKAEGNGEAADDLADAAKALDSINAQVADVKTSLSQQLNAQLQASNAAGEGQANAGQQIVDPNAQQVVAPGQQIKEQVQAQLNQATQQQAQGQQQNGQQQAGIDLTTIVDDAEVKVDPEKLKAAVKNAGQQVAVDPNAQQVVDGEEQGVEKKAEKQINKAQIQTQTVQTTTTTTTSADTQEEAQAAQAKQGQQSENKNNGQQQQQQQAQAQSQTRLDEMAKRADARVEIGNAAQAQGDQQADDGAELKVKDGNAKSNTNTQVNQQQAQQQLAAATTQTTTTKVDTQVTTQSNSQGGQVGSVQGSSSANNAQAAAKASAPAPAQQADVNQQVLRGVRAAVNQRGGTVTLNLNPGELGQLKIKVQINNGMVQASFQATTAQVGDMLNQQMSTLRQALESHGLGVERLNVQVQNTQDNANAGGQDQQQQSQDGRSRGSFTGNGGGQGNNGNGQQDAGSDQRRSFKDELDLVA